MDKSTDTGTARTSVDPARWWLQYEKGGEGAADGQGNGEAVLESVAGTPGMTFAQRSHANHIAQRFAAKIMAKYERGVIEHGGNLWERPPRELLDYAIDEAVDQACYLMTLREELYERPATTTPAAE